MSGVFASARQRQQLKRKILSASFNLLMFVYAFSVIFTAFITYPLLLGAAFACALSIGCFILSPIAAIIRYFIFTNMPYIVTRKLVAGLFLSFFEATTFVAMFAFATRTTFDSRREEFFSITQRLFSLYLALLYLESGIWMLSLFSFPKRILLGLSCLYHFFGFLVVFNDFEYNVAVKHKLKSYFKQANALGFLMINEITFHTILGS